MSQDTDWADIEMRYRKGESVSAIARTVDVTRQAIMKRRDKEGWLREVVLVDNLPETAPGHLVEHEEQRKALILKALSEGKSYKIAAHFAGVSDDTCRRWRKEDDRFAVTCLRAKAWHLGRHEENISEAGHRGDWKASAYILERDPDTKGQYKQQEGPGTAIQINVGINRDEVKIGD